MCRVCVQMIYLSWILNVKTLACVSSLLFLYIVFYLYLSLNGRYEPETVGLNGVKSYIWAPKYFVTDYKYNNGWFMVYFPLHQIDIRFWHTRDEMYSDKYPINEVETKDVGILYRAWGLVK